MKKLAIFCFISLCALFICLFTYNSKAAFSIGDVNGDGKISANDYNLVKKSILGISSLTGDNRTRADINFDNKISSQDYILIKKIMLNQISVPTFTPVPVTPAPTATSTPTLTPAPTSTPEPKPTRIHFLNTGGSNAFLLESNDHYALIDASNPYEQGTSWDEPEATSVGKVIKYLKNLGVTKLDVIIASHSHSDHIGGMEKIATNFVGSGTKYYYRTYSTDNSDDVLHPDWDNKGFYERSISAMKNAGAELVEVTKKDPYIVLGDFEISIMNTSTPRDNEYTNINGKKYVYGENKNSLAVYVKYGNFKTLIAGDMEMEDEMDVANSIGDIDILQMGHHGLYTSSSQEYIKTLKPNYVIVSTDNFDLSNDITRFSSIRLAQKNGAQVYLTTKIKDAVVFNCVSNTCSVTSNDALVNFTIERKDNSPWEKVTYSGKSAWFYYNGSIYVEDDWIKYDGKYYHFSNRGQMEVGWQEITWSGGTNWFYFDLNNGDMLTGWQKLSWKGGTNWFYFDPTDGYMYANTTKTIDGKSYSFDSNGVCTSAGC